MENQVFNISFFAVFVRLYQGFTGSKFEGCVWYHSYPSIRGKKAKMNNAILQFF